MQVTLDPSAMAVDGSGAAASVSVAGGNKAKLKDGTALFKSVRIEAEAPGVYTLHAKSASRKVSITARSGPAVTTQIRRDCNHIIPSCRA